MLSLFKFMQPRGFTYPLGEGRHGNRSLEWYLSLLELLFGVMLVAPNLSVLPGTPHEHLLGMMPEYCWGLAFGIKGAVHGYALYKNGDGWRWTPWVRAASCIGSSLFWAFLLWMLLRSPDWHPDFLYPLAALNTVTYALLARSCAHDAGQYWEHHRGGTP